MSEANTPQATQPQSKLSPELQAAIKAAQERAAATLQPSGKMEAPFFTSVRERGVLNSMLEDIAGRFNKSSPGWRARWEFSPPSGDNLMVVQREAMGFRIVDASEIPGTPSSQKSGPIRMGDLVLMAAPEAIALEIERQDAEAAEADHRLPERAYRESLEKNRIRTSEGSEEYARPVGKITKTTEYLVKQNEGGE